MKPLSTHWSNLISKVYKAYGENPGSMLLHTGAIGWILSSLAQISAILVNNKFTPEQKMFLVPQEASDALVNIISFYTLTSGVKFIGSKLVKSGKLRTAAITKLLKDRGLILEKGQTRQPNKVYAGDWDFDITKLPHYKFNIAPDFKPFKNGIEVLFALAGSIISGNIVTPIARNHYASKRQKEIIGHFNNNTKPEKPSINEKTQLNNNFNTFSQKFNNVYPPSGNMRV